LGTSFRTQLWGAAFGSNFAEQLSGAALENSFGEPLWGTGLKQSSFWGNLSAAVLWGTALGSSFVEQRAVLGSFFGMRLSAATLEGSFGEQLRGAILQLCSSIDKQLL